MGWFGGGGGGGDGAVRGPLSALARSASKSVATVLVVTPRVFAPQFVTYDLQFYRCLSLRIEIYGLTQSGRARRDKVTRFGPYARGYVRVKIQEASRLHLNRATVSLAISFRYASLINANIMSLQRLTL